MQAPMKSITLICSLAVVSSFMGCTLFAPPVDLSPARWEAGELGRFIEKNSRFTGTARGAEGGECMISGTTGALAVRAGMEALKQGGSAADAVLTTALTQVTLAGGSWVSYAGLLSMVYYDAGSDRVHSMNAAFDIPREEDAPKTIPAQGSGIPSGRTALVPGFMAGVQAAHDRFGRLPFSSLFEPAVYFAEQGIEVPAFLAGMIRHRAEVLDRLPEARRVFFKEDGSPYGEGDLFKQPELAATLRAVATQGAKYMYTGPWARRFVETVRREGGRVTLEDMSRYEPIWSEPLRTTYREYEIHAYGLPALGGVDAVEAMNLVEAANLDQHGHHGRSPIALFWLMQITNLFGLSHVTPQVAKMILHGRDVTPPERTEKSWAKWLWEKMQDGKCFLSRVPQGSHSDAVVAVDRWGNVAAIVHSINTSIWGETGLFVDGVSVPDAACFQQPQMAAAGPGQRLPDDTNPLLVFQAGKPVLASGSIGAGLHQATVQCLVNVLDHGMKPREAIDAPAFLLPSFSMLGRTTAQVSKGDFDAKLLDELKRLGQPVNELDEAEMRAAKGYWIGIRIYPETGGLSGGAPGGLNGDVLGR
jgi:gamma-glutamyltranspeptidase/glutathione hydrolase